MSSELNNFFKLVAQEKKQKKEEFESLVGDLGLDSVFEEVSILKTKSKIKNKKGHKALKVFEDFLSLNEIEPINEEVIEEIVEVVEELQEELEEPKYPTLMERSLGLLSEPSNIKQQNDPLTPLDQKFATLEDLEKHYKLFLSRIQQQLSTLGGGGETRLRYLDDIVGVATNSSAYNGKYLQWNSTKNRAEFTDPSDTETTTIVSITGITTYYQASNTDDYIGVNSNVPVTIVLPISPNTGKKLIVKDEGNKIATYNITVQAGAGTSVENDSSVIMNINHQSFTYFYNGSNWFLI
jgi:hypothetical protein